MTDEEINEFARKILEGESIEEEMEEMTEEEQKEVEKAVRDALKKYHENQNGNEQEDYFWSTGTFFAIALIACMIYAIVDNVNGSSMITNMLNVVGDALPTEPWFGALLRGAVVLDVIDHIILSPFVYLWMLGVVLKNFGREVAYNVSNWIIAIVIVFVLSIPVGRPFAMFIMTRTAAVKVGDGLEEIESKLKEAKQEKKEQPAKSFDPVW